MNNSEHPVRTSFFELFKIGPGPSSSHTIGPMKAAADFMDTIRALDPALLETAGRIEVRLYGSLSATGKGHGTDRAVMAGLLGYTPETCPPDFLTELESDGDKERIVTAGPVRLSVSLKNIIFDDPDAHFPCSNTLAARLLAAEPDAPPLFEREYYSVGGGFITWKGHAEPERGAPVLPYSTMNELKAVIDARSLPLHEVLLANEHAITGMAPDEIFERLDHILEAMEDAVERGMSKSGVLPGPIGLHRKASALKGMMEATPMGEGKLLPALNAAAFAVSEENAAGSRVVTAPTSGSAGVIPAAAYVMKHFLHIEHAKIREGLIASAAVGFLAKHNAGIAGAEVGCQGEIGVASSMAAAMLAYGRGHKVRVTENAAQTALEHHLGMTCDPVKGYVQIPCIERNAMGAVKAWNSALIAAAVPTPFSRVDLDSTIQAMLATGKAMPREFKETALGGLAACHIC